MDGKELGALPVNATVDANRAEDYGTRGITLRQHFAGLAMQGFSANSNPQIADAPTVRIAEWAVQQADALLAELAKET